MEEEPLFCFFRDVATADGTVNFPIVGPVESVTAQSQRTEHEFPTPVFAQGGVQRFVCDLEQHGAGRISELQISSTTSERSCWWKMFAGYVYMYTLSQYWLPQGILDVVSSVFSVVLNWGEHWVYALACSLLHVRWLPLESDDQKSSARWCKVCSYV